jgi:hypothetical protein
MHFGLSLVTNHSYGLQDEASQSDEYENVSTFAPEQGLPSLQDVGAS